MIQLVVRHAYPSTKSHPLYQCTLEEWDLGITIGYGECIEDAIDDFISSWQDKSGNEYMTIKDFKWIGTK